VDTEPAEWFLPSAADADAKVIFRIAGLTVCVSADGRVQFCRPSAADASWRLDHRSATNGFYQPVA
jgi:hypothetical protein